MAWYSTSWTSRIKVTVDHTKIGGSTLSSFPVFVDLGGLVASFFDRVQNGGADIRVTTSNGTTELAREVVSCDTSAKTGELHFLANSLSSSADTVFYVYFGNSGASDYAVTDTYGRNAVWASQHSVHHFDEDPSATAPQETDATGNGYNLSVATGSFASGDLVTGKLGRGVQLSGSNAFSKASANPTLSSPWTMSGWLYTPSFLSTQISFGYGGGSTFVAFGTISEWKVFTPSETGPRGSLPSTSTWYKFDVEWDGTSFNVYINGSLDYSVTPSGSTWQGGTELDIGGLYDGSTWTYLTASGAIVDELRVYAGNHTSGWRTAEYNNQSAPTSFYTAGNAEITMAVTDGLMIDDPTTRSQSGTITDELLLSDITAKALEAVTTDGLEITDAAAQIMLRLATENLLLGDSSNTAAVRNQVLVDQLLLNDALTLTQQHVLFDVILLSDTATHQHSKMFLDNLFLGSDGVLQSLRVLLATDGVYLDDTAYAQTVRKLVVQDSLLLQDERLSTQQHSVVDALLVADFAVRVLQKLVTDYEFLYDSYTTSARQIYIKVVVDALLLADHALKTQQHKQADDLFVFDSQVREQLMTIIDRLLVKSSQALQQHKTAQDGVALGESTHRTFAQVRQDGVALGDSSAAQQQKTTQDGVAVADTSAGQQHKTAQDGVALSDSLARIFAKAQQDGVLLGDSQTVQRWVTSRDALLLSDYVTRMIRALSLDDLLLYDSATVSKIASLAAVITYARLQSFDPLAVSNAATGNLLGMVVASNASLIGAVIGAQTDRSVH